MGVPVMSAYAHPHRPTPNVVPVGNASHPPGSGDGRAGLPPRLQTAGRGEGPPPVVAGFLLAERGEGALMRHVVQSFQSKPHLCLRAKNTFALSPGDGVCVCLVHSSALGCLPLPSLLRRASSAHVFLCNISQLAVPHNDYFSLA